MDSSGFPPLNEDLLVWPPPETNSQFSQPIDLTQPPNLDFQADFGLIGEDLSNFGELKMENFDPNF